MKTKRVHTCRATVMVRGFMPIAGPCGKRAKYVSADGTHYCARHARERGVEIPKKETP